MVEKQQILIQKNIRNVISVKAHCSMTHLKQQKNIWFLLVLHSEYCLALNISQLAKNTAIVTMERE